MNSKACTVKPIITTTLAWWWQPYVAGVMLTSMLTGAMPDFAKVQRMAFRAIRVTMRFEIDG